MSYSKAIQVCTLMVETSLRYDHMCASIRKTHHRSKLDTGSVKYEKGEVDELLLQEGM